MAITLTLHSGFPAGTAYARGVGLASADGVARPLFTGVGSASGAAVGNGVGSSSTSTGVGVGSSSGAATASGVGHSLVSGVGASAGVATVTGISSAIEAVVYDGVQGYMLHTGGPTGAADGAALTIVWAGTFNSDGSAMTLLDVPGTVPVKLERLSDNTIKFTGGTAGAVFGNVTTAVAASLGFLIVLASCNGTSSVLKVVHAAGTITGTNTPGSATSLDLTADWFFGADGGAADFLDADTAIWWADDSFIDFSDADNIEQFWDTTGDLLREPGVDGSNPLDGAFSPLVCHKSGAASHVTNSGTGGDADTAGTFTDGTSPGTYAGDFDAFSDPSDIASLEIWLKASVGTYTDAAKTTPATSNGDRIGAWADQSGNGHDFTQATDDNRPNLITAVVNGKPVIRVDIGGFVKYLDGPDLSSVFTAAECFLIVKVSDDPATGGATAPGSLMWKFGTQTPTTDTNHLPYTDGNVYDDFGSTTRKSTGNPTASLSSAFRCYNVVSVSGEWTSFIDATQHYTTATNTVGFTATPLLFNGPAGHGFRGDVAEMIIFNAKLSAGDKANVRSYITAEYGITF